MGLVQEVVHPYPVMPDHAQQRRAVTLPVGDAGGIDRLRIGRHLILSKHLGHVGIHVRVNCRKNRMGRVMQRVIEIEEPDRIAHDVYILETARNIAKLTMGDCRMADALPLPVEITLEQ